MALLITIFISIHLLELAAYLIYVQSKKNDKYEKILAEQDMFVNNISSVIRAGKSRLDDLDQLGAFRSDDELGVFFQNLKAIQDLLDKFISQKENRGDAS